MICHIFYLVSDITLFVAIKVGDYRFINHFILRECNGRLNINIFIMILRCRAILPFTSYQYVSDTDTDKNWSIFIETIFNKEAKAEWLNG